MKLFFFLFSVHNHFAFVYNFVLTESGLDAHFFRSPHRSNVDKREFFDVKVDCKKLAQFLNVQQLCPSRVICSKYSITISG